MKTRKLAFALAAGVAMLTALAFSAGTGHAGAVTETVRITSVDASGAQASVTLEALGMVDPGLGAWSIDVEYDPGVLEATSCSPANGSVCNPAYDTDTVKVVGAAAAGLEGDVMLATVNFSCQSAGDSALTLILNTFADATPGSPTDIEAVTQNGSVSCAAGEEPNVNKILIGSGSAEVGENVSVQLDAVDMQPPGMGAWTLDVSYDPAVISAVGCEAAAGSVCNAQFDGDTVRVTGANADGIEGNAALATLTFQCGDNQGFSPLIVSSQVLVDATVGNPQPIDGTLGEGQIDCTPPPGEAVPTPTATPTGGLPDSGTGFGGGGGSPFDWFVAGLIGAGIAWVIAGLAGARFATASAGPGSPSRPPRQRQEAFRPSFRPTRSVSAAPPRPARQAPLRKPERPQSDTRKSWLADAADNLAGKNPEQFRPFRKRDE